ncbi:MAG: hypothetical protein EZS28_032913 [Streblomastix strix]|uniref:Uncharacterized protein n=1 Tax=Streblomastix strix TaxID=222440 RepID=A0A5J4UNK7_9EUKA|nr:MAG: hypothetical protein EZS28_032913 [Streblomastix strix]
MCATAFVSGEIGLFDRNQHAEQTMISRTLPVYDDSTVRSLNFSPNGMIFVGRTNNSVDIIDPNVDWRKNKHGKPICITNSLVNTQPVSSSFIFDDNRISCGGEEGAITIWDIRQANSPSHLYKDTHEGYITDFSTSNSNQLLAATSEDGAFSIFNISNGQVEFITCSEDLEQPLQCCCFLEQPESQQQIINRDQNDKIDKQTFVVAPQESSSLMLFNVPDFGMVNCRMNLNAKNECVATCIVGWDDSTFLSSWDDGLIRVQSSRKKKILLNIGKHTNGITGCDKIVLSPDRALIASVAFTNEIILWKTEQIFEITGIGDDDELSFSESSSNESEKDNDSESSHKQPTKKRRMEDGSESIQMSESSEDENTKEDKQIHFRNKNLKDESNSEERRKSNIDSDSSDSDLSKPIKPKKRKRYQIFLHFCFFLFL